MADKGEDKSPQMDKYKKVKVLGKGSFGKAYLVEKTDSGQLCVIKQMETNMMNQQEKEEAIREAQLLKRMNHPNITRFYEVFMTRRGRLCIVMDYCDGGDLHQFIKKRQGELLPESQILSWFVQICLALKHVHDRKVLHRDLKSQNIFLTSYGIVKLGDFGIARVLEATKDFAKTMVGTPYYLSPEIIEERPYNFKSDVWSLGVVLYEMTTLKHPFDAESLHFLAIKILKGNYPEPDARYSGELKSLIRMMLNRDPDKRPQLVEVLRLPFLRPYVERACELSKLDVEKELQAMAISPSKPSTGPDVPLAMDGVKTANSMVVPPQSPPKKGAAHDDESDEEKGSPQKKADPSNPRLNLGKDAGLGGSRVHTAKAESLRQYLLQTVSKDEFDRAYAVVRKSNQQHAQHDAPGHVPQELQAQLREVLGAERCKDLGELFQLLVFLEDVAKYSGQQ